MECQSTISVQSFGKKKKKTKMTRSVPTVHVLPDTIRFTGTEISRSLKLRTLLFDHYLIPNIT